MAMKTPLEIIKSLVDKYPNDMKLGQQIRYYINTLFDRKDDER